MRKEKTDNMSLSCTYLIIYNINTNCFKIDRETRYKRKEHKILEQFSASVVGRRYLIVLKCTNQICQ